MSHEISGVPLIEQSDNQCGPASLATVARFSGLDHSSDELSLMMFTEGKKGTLQLDMMGASRRIGLLTVPVTGLRSVFAEISADHPVIVLLNLGSSSYPIWHYAVVTGFHLSDEEVTLHWGKNEPLRMDLAEFERAWKKADYWAVTALSPQTLPRSASTAEIITAASALERVGKTREANLAYQTLLKNRSENGSNQVVLLFGLGNTFATLGQWSKSAKAFEKASELDPKSGAIWNNLSEVYKKLRQPKLSAQALKNARATQFGP